MIDKTQQTISESYQNFGLVLSRTLATESTDLIKGLPPEDKKYKLEFYSEKLMHDNKDIEYIIYKNNESEVLYQFGSKPQKEDKNAFSINVPMYLNENIVGSVEIGFTGSSMTGISKTTRNSMIIIFTVIWLLSMLAVLINTLLITRQISLLSKGVKKISSGEFGYKLEGKDLWGEIKLLFDEFNHMSTKLRKYEEENIEELAYEKNKLESVLMSIVNGVVVCDNYDNVILINNAGLSVLKVKPEEILNKKIQSYCDINGNFAFEQHISEFKNTPREEIEQEPLVFQANIEEKIYQTSISPIFTPHEDYLGYVIVLHDITKEAQIDKLKNNFISNVSHELRTPVTVLRSYIDTLCNYGNDFDEKTKHEFLQIMNQEAKRLNNMVNDILDFSRLESPNVKIEKQLLDLKPIVELTVASINVIASEKNIKFSVITEPDLPKVYMNPDSIERSLKNLLSNAIKYSPEDSRVKIRIEIDNTGQYLECTIEDSGIGIPSEHLDKVFDRFYRVETEAHTIKGTGLGLHLVKLNIEKHHGGQVFVESKAGTGSKFGFRLPLNTVDSADNNTREVTESETETDTIIQQ